MGNGIKALVPMKNFTEITSLPVAIFGKIVTSFFTDTYNLFKRLINMTTIIDILKVRSSAEENKLDSKLYSLAEKLSSIAEDHQKRVIKIMPEFDLHDNTHLVKVEQNIVQLLGDETLQKLSSLELFLLSMAAKLHDCGMAPADWEIKLMSLTEGTDSIVLDENSCHFDGKIPMTIKEAKAFIIKNKSLLYKDFETVKEWQFSPKDEETLINSLSELLADYQKYRNGFTSELCKIDEKSKFEQYNQYRRVDYIRLNHHKKSSQYVCNLLPMFETYLGEVWSQRLLLDLSKICQSHGENIDFLRKLKTEVKYIDDTSVNPQFIAVMLRLGDIIHYSYDRAPLVLRSAMCFNSDYSKHEWTVKVGLSYAISDRKISYIANCQTPKDYYHIHKYLDWIDEEINILDSLKRNWASDYKIDIQEVNRENVDYDHNAFTPVNGSGFTLNQNKIIELLMGVNLYKDPFSCLRELYQNSLDACRCMIDIGKKSNHNIEGNIEFGIEEDKEGEYLYCKDNGLGMSEYIIENYLLKIGNSFYKSADYSRKRAQWASNYTPVSQFGIGILSCFIIGTKLEIMTRFHETKKLIICCIDGVYESVYYRTPTREDEEAIEEYGTIIKVYLNSEYVTKINNTPIEKIGLAMQYLYTECDKDDEYASYHEMFHNWNSSLYRYLNEYVNSVPDHINLRVRFKDNTSVPIFDKPLSIKIGELGITDDDQPFIDYAISRQYLRHFNGSIYGIQKYLKQYLIDVKTDNISYKTIITLPLPGMIDLKDDLAFYRHLHVIGSRVSVDGISVSAPSHLEFEDMYYTRLIQNGSLNYDGNIRPQLSVDRKVIISYPYDYKSSYKDLTEKEISQIIQVASTHIQQYKLYDDIFTVDLIWKYIFSIIGCGQVLFINKLATSSLGLFKWPTINQMLDNSMDIKEIMSADCVMFKNYNHNYHDIFAQKVVMALTISAQSIDVISDNVIVIKKGHTIDIPEIDYAYRHSRYLVPCVDSKVFEEYDIISNLYPIVPKRLVQSLKFVEMKLENSNAIMISATSNSYNELFFQDSRLVNPSVGLYSAKGRFGREPDHYIHEFDTRKNNFQCMDFIPNFSQRKEAVPIFAYIAPTELTERDKELLLKYKDSEPDYYKGVHDGWSVLVTNMETENVIIKPGKVSRKEMVSSLSDDFWETYKEWTFRFLDGSIMQKCK